MIRHLLILVLLLTTLAHADEYQVNEIYETYLPAEKLVPVLEPMLGPEDRITPFRNKLLVKAPRERQNKLLEILQEIDRPLHNILISVRYGANDNTDTTAIDATVHYEDADKGVQVNAGELPKDQVKVFQGSSLDDKIRVRTLAKSHFSTRDENALSQIRVLEGSQGFLQVGEEMPQQHYVLLNPNGFGSTTEYRMVGNGVYVMPQIVKDKVRLEIFTTQQRPKTGSNNIEKTDAQSVMVVEPDVWTPFAGSSVQSRAQGKGSTLSTRNLKSDQNRSLELKVTILD